MSNELAAQEMALEVVRWLLAHRDEIVVGLVVGAIMVIAAKTARWAQGVLWRRVVAACHAAWMWLRQVFFVVKYTIQLSYEPPAVPGVQIQILSKPTLARYAAMREGAIFSVLSDKSSLVLFDPVYGSWVFSKAEISGELGAIKVCLENEGYTLVFSLQDRLKNLFKPRPNPRFYSARTYRLPELYRECMSGKDFRIMDFRVQGESGEMLDIAVTDDRFVLLKPVYGDWASHNLFAKLGIAKDEASIAAYLVSRGYKIVRREIGPAEAFAASAKKMLKMFGIIASLVIFVILVFSICSAI